MQVYADDIREDATVLFLKNLNQNKDKLYTFEESKIIQDVFVWFMLKLDINLPDEPISGYSYFTSNKNIETMRRLIDEI